MQPAKTRIKSAGANLAVPQNDSEARQAIREIGDLTRETLRLTAEMNDKLAALKQEYGDKAAPLTDRVKAMQEGVRIFAEANRERLTQNGKVKFHKFSTGEISWRLRPAKVSIRGMEAVIEAIKSAGLRKKFLRTKEELNKEAMLEKDNRAQAAAIKGIAIGSDGEDFIVEPYETEISDR